MTGWPCNLKSRGKWNYLHVNQCKLWPKWCCSLAFIWKKMNMLSQWYSSRFGLHLSYLDCSVHAIFRIDQKTSMKKPVECHWLLWNVGIFLAKILYACKAWWRVSTVHVILIHARCDVSYFMTSFLCCSFSLQQHHIYCNHDNCCRGCDCHCHLFLISASWEEVPVWEKWNESRGSAAKHDG